MSIPVECPNGHKHKVKDRYAGTLRLCPDCRAKIEVPGGSASPTDVYKSADADAPQPETPPVPSADPAASPQKAKNQKLPGAKAKETAAPKNDSVAAKKSKGKKKPQFDEDDILDILMD